MKLFTGSLAAGLVLLAGSVQAQVPGPYRAVSDFDAVAPSPVPGPQYVPGPHYGPGQQYGYGPGPGPGLLPSTEVYSVLRDNGFSPLGIPRLRGVVYTIAVIDRGGEDGRLVIDARNGRIIRFLPAYRMVGRRQLLRRPEYPRWTLRGAAAAGPSAGPCPGRAAAVTAGPCCEPLGADAEGQPDSRQACAGTSPAGGRACPETG